MATPRIARIERGRLEGRRPRLAGCNARLAVHGLAVRPSLVRLTLDDGRSGFGWSSISREDATSLLGGSLQAAWDPTTGPTEAWRGVEYPLWDLMAKAEGLPVYALVARMRGERADGPLSAPCYDTSLYIDDLHLADDGEAGALIAAEAREGYDRGHRAFKIKVGRGARHMPLEAGTRRDIAVVRAVREAVGAGCPLMLDANNGYNLNLTKRVLADTADVGVFWMEEPFHEDPVLYEDLKAWLRAEQLSILVADGEGEASPRLLDYAERGLIDVVQYDILIPGFARWLDMGHRLDAWGVRTAPHHYGGHWGNFATPHLAGAIRHFTFVEWDEATVDGLDTSGYVLQEGRVRVPLRPGFGLELDEGAFRGARERDGFDLAQ